VAAWQEFADELVGIAGDYVRSGGIQVAVKTNLGPEFTVATSSMRSGGGSGQGGGSGGGGLLSLLGVRASVVVRDKSGNRIATYGEYPQTSYIRAAVAAGLVAVVAGVFVRGLMK